jgi:hypothetical protein
MLKISPDVQKIVIYAYYVLCVIYIYFLIM